MNKIKCIDNGTPCIVHKEGKYKKWPCGNIPTSLLRREIYLKSRVRCEGCQKYATKKYCRYCYYKYNTHYLKGKKLPANWCKNISLGQGKGSDNKSWKGEKATYWSKHKGLVSKHGNPLKCVECGVLGKKNRGGKWTIQWANISKKYTRDIKDYKGLCTRCHSVFDGKTKPIDDYNHGTVSRYRKGCRCLECVSYKKLYRRGLVSHK